MGFLKRHPVFDLVILAVTIAALLGAQLGERPYSAPSESRYIEIGREMAESGDYVTPRLNYVKYFEKPPLFYWVQAGWTEVFGTGTFASRVPNALFAVGLCLVTYALGRLMQGRLAGMLAALCLASTLFLFSLSRIVLLDLCVAFFITGALTCFLYAVDTPPSRRRSALLYIMYGLVAGAVLSKGLIGLVIPGLIALVWLALTGRWHVLRRLHIPTGLVLFLALAAPWHLLVWLRNPEHAYFYFVHEHLLRYFTPGHGRGEPFWLFFAVLAAGFFPWVTFLPQAARGALAGAWTQRREVSAPLFTAVWAAVVVLFFTLSHSKLVPYIAPAFPPLAAWLGGYFARSWRGQKVPGFALGLTLFLLGLAMLTGLPALSKALFDPAGRLAATLQQAGDEVQLLAYFCMAAAALLLVAAVQGTRRHSITAMLVVSVLLMQLGDRIAAHYNTHSTARLANIIKELEKPGDEVATYDVYYQDLPLHLNRKISIANWKGELGFGAVQEDTSGWMLSFDAFWQRWLNPGHRMFLLMRAEKFNQLSAEQPPEQRRLFALMQDGEVVLLANRPAQELQAAKQPAQERPHE